MEYGICNIGLIPVRSEPDDRSEMVTQILFGEMFKIVEYNPKWAKIILDFDGYEGWIDKKQVTGLDHDQYKHLASLPFFFSFEPSVIISIKEDQTKMPIVIGSVLRESDQNNFSTGIEQFTYTGKLIEGIQVPSREKIIQNAIFYLNSPYLWGGKTPYGIDCSGFTQMVYKISGLHLLRDASQQSLQGESISFISEALPGDLLFFDDEEENIIHTGILLTENKIIHASGKVRIDMIDHHGIYNKEQKKYTHKLRLIKTLFN